MQNTVKDNMFSLRNDEDFNAMALQIFNFQYQNNGVFHRFVSQLNMIPSEVKHYSQIPFLPIGFFKSHEIICGKKQPSNVVFTSSATTSQIPSKHIVSDISLYEMSFLKGFEWFYGNPKDYVIIALLPNYLERQGSSLVFMFDKLIQLSENDYSGFFRDDLVKLKALLKELKNSGQKTILLGVTYSLLDLAEQEIKLNDNFIVMETGGMKGRRKEMLKEELHTVLKEKFGVSGIHSEYGMTELLSQAYSKKDGIFVCPPWMKVMVRDIEDPLSLLKENKTGGINVIDLANVNSCSFIATQDLGRMKSDGSFELMGRFDNSDIRGCNLMVE